jgi:hypothetical protein
MLYECMVILAPMCLLAIGDQGCIASLVVLAFGALVQSWENYQRGLVARDLLQFLLNCVFGCVLKSAMSL